MPIAGVDDALLVLEVSGKTAGDRLRASVVLATLPLLLVVIVVFRSDEKLHGSARWARRRELPYQGLRSQYGVVCGHLDGDVLIAESPGHVLLQAPTGGGKGVGIIVPTLLGGWPGSVIVTDIKGENYQLTSGFRRSAGQDVFYFDPFAVDSHCFNPLDRIVAGPGRIDEVDRVASMLIPIPEKDPIWAAQAQDVFKGVALHLWSVNGSVSLPEVLQFVQDGTALAKKISELIDAGEVVDPEAYRLLSDFAAASDDAAKTMRGVLVELTSRLKIYGNPYVARATSRSDFEWSTLRRKTASIYIGVTLENLIRLAPLIALLYQQSIDALARSLPGADEPYEVLLLIDEFAQLPRMDILVKALAFLRGYKIRIMIVVQSKFQLDAIYGSDRAKEILDNCHFQVVMRPNNMDTATEVSKRLGTKTVKSRNTSSNSSSGKRSYGRSESDQRRDLMMPQEVITMSDDRVIVFAGGGFPVYAEKVRYFEDRHMQKRLFPAAHSPFSVRSNAVAVAGPLNSGSPDDVYTFCEQSMLEGREEFAAALAIHYAIRGDDLADDELKDAYAVANESESRVEATLRMLGA